MPQLNLQKPATPKDYKQTRIQVRLLDGTLLNETFDVKEKLAVVKSFINDKTENINTKFSLMTTFPRRVFSIDDLERTLDSLGLVPSAVLIVARPSE